MPPSNTSSDFVRAATHDIRLYAGDTWPATQLIFEDEGGSPIDFTGCMFKMQIKSSAAESAHVAELMLGSGLTLSGPSHNILTIQGVALPPGRYVYDLKVTFPDTTVVTYLMGAVVVLQNVTQ